jgi:hypothetical protein
MLTIRNLLVAAAVVGGVAVTSSQALAWGQRGCSGPFCNQSRYPALKSYLLQGHLGNSQPKPTFQAAPWYLYWPYDGHFMTPAPIHAPFHAPPGTGNFPVNPYFPAPAGPYGPMPGGPAPGGVPIGPGSFNPAPMPPRQ